MINRKNLYQKYFKLNINQRINERQQRNSLNINSLFSTVISDSIHSNYETTHPKINNGIYHHIGKSHSKYPETK
jgi:hypothetical protein